MKFLYRNFFKTLVWFIFFSFIGCIDAIDIEIEDEVILPVLDGYITNETKAHLISLSTSQKFSNEAAPSVSGASVIVYDSEGNEEPFVDLGNGLYVSRNTFRGIPGRSYYLEVIWPDGTRYVSSPQKMPSETSIQDAYFEESVQIQINQRLNRRVEIEGISIKTPVVNDGEEEKFYKYEVFPTWIYEAPRASESSPLKYCWVDDFNNTFSILRDKSGGFDHTIGFYQHTSRFHFGISFKVVQLSMSKEAFDFWEDVKTQSEYDGSIFDVPPFSIRGNMERENISDPEMLGFFGVYSEDFTRINLADSLLSFNMPYDRAECFPPNRRFRRSCFFCTEYPSDFITPNRPDYWPE